MAAINSLINSLINAAINAAELADRFAADLLTSTKEPLSNARSG